MLSFSVFLLQFNYLFLFYHNKPANGWLIYYLNESGPVFSTLAISALPQKNSTVPQKWGGG